MNLSSRGQHSPQGPSVVNQFQSIHSTLQGATINLVLIVHAPDPEHKHVLLLTALASSFREAFQATVVMTTSTEAYELLAPTAKVSNHNPESGVELPVSMQDLEISQNYKWFPEKRDQFPWQKWEL